MGLNAYQLHSYNDFISMLENNIFIYKKKEIEYVKKINFYIKKCLEHKINKMTWNLLLNKIKKINLIRKEVQEQENLDEMIQIFQFKDKKN
ncbi:hypothetical protein [Buchnera aphidicola]|uniref:hypothetical protein n=1 Tax=Buchnera aphidicola TaxID=9 RepID=UPI0034639AFF